MNKELMKLVLNNGKVNCETKLIIILYWWNHYKQNYIPNQKLVNRLSIYSVRTIQTALKHLEETGIIKIWYHGKKRYFSFNSKYGKVELLDYNWLEDFSD